MEFLRSLLSVPGQRQKMIDKAIGLLADGIVLDLEDAVPSSMKAAARRNVAQAVGRRQQGYSPSRFVRVNAINTGIMEDDIQAVAHERLVGIVIPKVEHVDELKYTDQFLHWVERTRSLPEGNIRLLISVESGRGLRSVYDLVDASPRNLAVFMGGEDFSLDLGLPVVRTGAGREQIFARSTIVVAAASAGLYSVDQGSLEFKDLESFRRHTHGSRELGFTTGWCIHPNQISIANEIFSPSPDEVAYARRVVAAFDEAAADGLGAVMMEDQFVERPIVERAQRTLQLFDAISARADHAAPTD